MKNGSSGCRVGSPQSKTEIVGKFTGLSFAILSIILTNRSFEIIFFATSLVFMLPTGHDGHLKLHEPTISILY